MSDEKLEHFVLLIPAQQEVLSLKTYKISILYLIYFSLTWVTYLVFDSIYSVEDSSILRRGLPVAHLIYGQVRIYPSYVL